MDFKLRFYILYSDDLLGITKNLTKYLIQILHEMFIGIQLLIRHSAITEPYSHNCHRNNSL